MLWLDTSETILLIILLNLPSESESSSEPATQETRWVWVEGTVRPRSDGSPGLQLDLRRRYFPLRFGEQAESESDDEEILAEVPEAEAEAGEARLNWSDSEPDDDLPAIPQEWVNRMYSQSFQPGQIEWNTLEQEFHRQASREARREFVEEFHEHFRHHIDRDPNIILASAAITEVESEEDKEEGTSKRPPPSSSKKGKGNAKPQAARPEILVEVEEESKKPDYHQLKKEYKASRRREKAFEEGQL